MLLCAEQSCCYPYSSNGTLEDDVDGEASLVEVLHQNINEFLTNTVDNGLKVASDLFDGVKSTIDGLSGGAKRFDKIFEDFYKGFEDGRGGVTKTDPFAGIDDEKLDRRFLKLDGQVQTDWGNVINGKRPGMEKNILMLLQESRAEIVNAGRGKQFLAEKVKQINHGLNELIIVVADQTEDIQTKAKPVVDVIAKVDEIIKTPEVQAAINGLQRVAEDISDFLTLQCNWMSSREKYAYFGYWTPQNTKLKFWVDEEYVRCLSRKWWSITEIAEMLEDMTGATQSEAENYLTHWFNW